MSVREARQSDLRGMAEVAAASFMDEELFGVLMHPHRHEYPEDFIMFFETKFSNHWHDPTRHFVVGIDPASEKVTAVAEWQRQAACSSSGETESVEILVSENVIPNRAADPSKATILEDTFPSFAHHWSGPRADNWFLELLATHPQCQGTGLGRMLVQWGIDQAVKEGICTSLISAFSKNDFYAKFRFVEVGRANVGPLKENGIRGGAIMFRDVTEI